ncbi:MAG: preprotein translocase subunit SecG [Pseudomonadota bacterium]
MENVILTIHLILALLLIGVVLLQRSEGGGLGMGGGGGGAISARGAATALTKLTWIFAVGFIITSITLTVLAARTAASGSVVDQIGGTAAPADAPATDAPLGSDLLPPTPADAPATPPRADQGTAEPAAPATSAPATGTAAPVAPAAPAAPAPAAPAPSN